MAPPPPHTAAAPRPFSILVIFLLLSLSNAAPLARYSYPNNRLISSCVSSARGGSLCFHIPRMQRHRPVRPLPSPPPLSDDEIDPRYGVEKRLVPSGPNPLHN
ncbi:hypothetical protein SAY86_014014 [Trapa natans]|uniref:Uncharacterized protein n=1 Tax=Trapa natans TaxID=22666 RepID=A0AAN7KTD0_TRANT|nr:hypothetical protein SAY86_014014 [Trapa natans]